MIETWSLTIPELTGEMPRRAYVYVPDYWEEAQGERFPVLYMFDGHNVFFDEHATYGKSWGMGEYLKETAAPLIVAAVECNHSPNNGRLSEYSPYSFQMRRGDRIRGRGKVTMEWMVNTFKPMIDREFPTLPERENTFIAGSSMGGLMSLYALLEYNHTFSRAAALSPSLWVTPGRMEHLVKTAQIDLDTVLYMDYGSEELGNHAAMLKYIGQMAQLLLSRRIALNCRIVPGGNHSEASWERQIPFFMDTLFYGKDY